MNIQKLIGGIGFKSIGKALGFADRLSRADAGILKVAFMVAALDGEVSDAEYDTFVLMAKKCRGGTEASAEKVLDEAMRSAGYLLLKAGRIKDDAALVRVFIDEAERALPGGFAYCDLADVRRAVVTWIAMAMSDGDYSPRERACIEALWLRFAELRVEMNDAELERWKLLMPGAREGVGMLDAAVSPVPVQLVTQDFVGRVERLVAEIGDSEEAAAALKALVEEG